MKNYFPSDSHGTACSPTIHGVLREIRKSGLQSNKKAAHPFFFLVYQTPVRSKNSDFFFKEMSKMFYFLIKIKISSKFNK